VALHRHPWSQVRPGVQRLGRFVSRGPWRRPAGDQVFSYSLSVGAGIGVAVGVVGFKSARNGGRVEPERSFVNCVDAADLRIAAPGRLGPPRLRNALAVQARKPKRPRRAPPPSLDETALGRSGEESALHGACSRFRFALAVPIQTPCSIATSPRSSQATLQVHTRWATRRLVLRPRPPTRPRSSNPRVAHVDRL
jgi:hypothetical protein